jgi:phosphoesterase RecJ-like protein
MPVSALLSIREWLSPFERPLVVSHRRPDGDALGALAATVLALEQLGKRAEVALFGPLPTRYVPVVGQAIEWKQWSEECERLLRTADALVIVDTCSQSQLEPLGEFAAHGPPTLVIDHHVTRDAIGARREDLRVIDESAGACCLILHEWFEAAGVSLTPMIATALFTGIATDCGWFRYPNADARLLRAAADLVEAGVDGPRIYGALYQQEPLAKLRLIGGMLSRMEVLASGRLAVLTLREEDFARAGANGSMSEDLVNEAGRLQGAEVTLMLSQEDGQTVRINLRSRGAVDVAAIAQRFGGGGHPRAAGARVRGTWDDVASRAKAELLAALVGSALQAGEARDAPGGGEDQPHG